MIFEVLKNVLYNYHHTGLHGVTSGETWCTGADMSPTHEYVHTECVKRPWPKVLAVWFLTWWFLLFVDNDISFMLWLFATQKCRHHTLAAGRSPSTPVALIDIAFSYIWGDIIFSFDMLIYSGRDEAREKSRNGGNAAAAARRAKLLLPLHYILLGFPRVYLRSCHYSKKKHTISYVISRPFAFRFAHLVRDGPMIEAELPLLGWIYWNATTRSYVTWYEMRREATYTFLIDEATLLPQSPNRHNTMPCLYVWLIW